MLLSFFEEKKTLPTFIGLFWGVGGVSFFFIEGGGERTKFDR
jgi:hypothetical protein